MSIRTAIINTKTGIVEFVLMLDEVKVPLDFISTHTAVANEQVNIGWTWDGAGLIAPPSPPPIVPQSVSPRQARLALSAAGLLDQVNAVVNAAGGATLITWEYATEINRIDPLITQLGATLNFSSEQIDQLFTVAATL